MAFIASIRLPICERSARSTLNLSPPAPLFQPRPPREGFIYFIQAGLGGPVKIGIANDPVARLSEFQTAHHETLTLLAQFRGTQADEFRLHEEFAEHRIRGEWFDACVLELCGVDEFDGAA